MSSIRVLCAVLSTVSAMGCAGGLPEYPAQARPSSPLQMSDISQGTVVEQVLVVSDYIGRYDSSTGRLTFTRPGERSNVGAPRPGYTQAISDTVTFDDNSSAVVGAVPFAGGMCDANQLCAVVRVVNDSSTQLKETRVVLYDLSGGATIANGDALGTNYPTNGTSAGGWSYGSLAASGGEGSKTWRIAIAGGADFSFRVAVWATYTRTAYVASDVLTLPEASNADSADGAWSDTTPAWRDACLVSGSELISGSTGFSTVYRTPQFPSAIYGTAINTDGWSSGVEISSAGTLGIGGVGAEVNYALTTSYASDYTFYPFWDNLESTNGSVCAALDATSAAPNRRYVVTWKDVNISGYPNSRLTFSAVLQERTDNVWFLYHKWSTGASGCSTSGSGSTSVRGGGATVGVRGNTSAQVTSVSVDTAFLPLHGASPCPGDGAFISLTATPVNP